MNSDAKARLSQKIVDQIAPILAGKNPDVVGAVLADLTAMWLTGHVVPGDPHATARMRKKLREHHYIAVAGLIDVNAEQSGAALVAAKAAGRG